MWDDIYGDSVMNAVAFSGGNYIAAPPTNMTATPKIRNVTVQNVKLTNVEGGYQGISTLQESPIDGLYLRNISFTMTKVHRASWTCEASHFTLTTQNTESVKYHTTIFNRFCILLVK